MPLDISTKRGPQFTSQLWSALAELLGTKLHKTTAYHPQANGLVERFHRHLKASLKTRLSSPSWSDELPWVLLGIRTTPKEDLGTSSAELVYGAPLTLPGEFVTRTEDPTIAQHLQRLRETVQGLVPIQTSFHHTSKSYVPMSLKDTKFVFIRRDAHRDPLQKPYEGPFEVLEAGDKAFKIKVGNREESISVDRLKPGFVDENEDIQLAQPKRRGRPPKQQQSDAQPSEIVRKRRGRPPKNKT